MSLFTDDEGVASILLSGNSFNKTKRLADFFGLKFVSSSTYYRMQRLYLIPATDEWWSWMSEEILEEFSGDMLLVVMANVTLQGSLPKICATFWLKYKPMTSLTLKFWIRDMLA